MRISRQLPLWTLILATLLAFAISSVVYFFLHARDLSENFPIVYLALANSVLLFALGLTVFMYADSRRLRLRQVARLEEKMSGALQHLDNVFLARTGLSAYLIKNQTEPLEIESCVKRSSEYLRYLTDEARSLFEGYTGHPCAVSIKLLVPPTAGSIPAIKTYMRDQKSQLIRSDIYKPDGLYPYTAHSPFVDLVSGKVDAAYVCNDLRAAEAAGQYRNGNPFWKKLYNSTLVVPIKEPSTFSGENVVGFLSVDSLTAKFDAPACIYIARIIANTVFYVIYALSALEARKVLITPPEGNSRKAADAQ